MLKNLSVVVLLAAAFVSGACNMMKSPTEPSQVPNIPLGTTIHQVPLPGVSAPFRWWLSHLQPAKNSQLVAGQQYVIGFACDAPDGYSFFIQGEFSGGPGTPPINPDGGTQSSSFREAGDTDGCAGSSSSWSSTVNSRAPDLPYFRFTVWVAAGRGGFDGISPNRPPDIVVDEPIGWRHPG